MHKAAAQLVTEVPYDTAQALFCELTGVPFGSERMHTVTNQMAQELTVLDVAPSPEEITRRVAAVAAGRWRRPVVVLGIDGAYVPTRPDSAREREHSVILTFPVAAVRTVQTRAPVSRYTSHSAARASDCCWLHTTTPPSA